MTLVRLLHKSAAGLTLGVGVSLAICAPSAALAQIPLGTGSGTGTGTGMSGGAPGNSTGTGMESGGPGSPTGSGLESGVTQALPGANQYDPLPRSTPRVNPNDAVPFGPGIDVTFPDEQDIIPIDMLLGTDTGGPRASELTSITDAQLEYAQKIPVPSERSLALSRIAAVATSSMQLDMARKALDGASQSALLIRPGLIRDQRLISILTAYNNLATNRLIVGGSEDVGLPVSTLPADPAPDSGRSPQPADPGVPPPVATALPPIPAVDRLAVIRSASEDWARAAENAGLISNRTYKSEYLARVAESMAAGSSKIIIDFPSEAPDDPGGVDPAKPYGGLPDRILEQAAELSGTIERPVWHDQALVYVVLAATDSLQLNRAEKISRMIPHHEVRTGVLIKIAEVAARRGDADEATNYYRLAAESAALIPQTDPRSVLTGVLIDSLIAVGRFEDARAAVALYPDEASKVLALGAVAESQGRRGAAISALKWINAESAPRYRSWLYRRVSNGVSASVKQNRNFAVRDSATP